MELFNHAFILIERTRKNELLRYREKNPGMDFKILDKKTLLNQLLFDYDDRAVLYLHRKGIRFENAVEMLNSMMFIHKGINKKIDALCDLKEELISLGYAYHERYRAKYYQQQKWMAMGYIQNDSELQYLKDHFHLQIETQSSLETKELSYYHFSNVEEEIRYVLEQIAQQYKKGIQLKQIKIVAEEPYLLELKKYANFYSFHFHFPANYTYDMTNEFRSLLKFIEGQPIDKIFDFEVEIDDLTCFHRLLEKFVDVKEIIEPDEMKEYLTYIARKIPYETQRYENEIEIISLEDAQIEDYVYLLGFNLDAYPHIHKDDDYLSDEEKKELGMMTSTNEQKQESFNILNQLNTLEHLYISFSDKYQKEVFYPSHFTKGMKKLTYECQPHFYSKKHFEFYMGKLMDDERIFSYHSPELCSISKEEIGYFKYQHQFVPFTSYEANPSLYLSFTSIDSFIKCPFHYYLTYVLKADDFEETINLKIGNMMHKNLEDIVKKQERTFEEYLEEYAENKEECALIRALKPQIELVNNHFKDLLKHTHLNNPVAEQTHSGYEITPYAKLNGKIDLILQNQSSYIIVDHKTGEFDFSPNKIQYGLSMQLPLYYLLTQKKMKNQKLEGLYIHQLLSKDYYKGEYKYLALDGISFHDNSIDLIQGQGDFVKKKKLFDEEEFKKIVEQAKQNLSLVVEAIQKGEFFIAPKYLNSKNISCEHCPFVDVCYHDYHDYIYLSPKEDDQ